MITDNIHILHICILPVIKVSKQKKITNLYQNSNLGVPLPDHGPIVYVRGAAYDVSVVGHQQLGVHVQQLGDGLAVQHAVRAQPVERDVGGRVRHARLVQAGQD